MSGVSQRRQATRAGWLGAQGLGKARTGFAETMEALRRQHGLARVERWRREKQRNRKETNSDGIRALKAARKQREAMQGLLRANAKPRAAIGALGTEQKVVGGVA